MTRVRGDRTLASHVEVADWLLARQRRNRNMDSSQGDDVKTINRYTLIALVSAASACSGVPMSVREYAASLPARADGQYGPLDAAIKKQLVQMDALLPCAIDVADKKSADESPACRCSKSSSADWTADCKAWLGSHVPGADGPRTGSTPAAGSN